MEPQLPEPQIPNLERPHNAGIENGPDNSQGAEYGALQNNPEKGLINPELDNHTAPASGGQPLQQAADDVQQAAQQQSVPVDPQQPPTQSNPIVANDDDVIEKEWVDKAKQLIKDTSNDPRLQKHGASALQADYLEKRYGKIIKVPDES